MTGMTSRPAPDLAAGRLLISSPLIGGPEFTRTIVLLLDVDDTGALGVVLNRPSDVPLAGLLGAWEDLVTAPAVVFRGGPVDPQAALGVARLADGVTAPIGWRQMFDRTGLVDLDTPAFGTYDAVRVYAGYAGWSPGQLEGEVASGAWYVVPAEPGDLDAADGEALWSQVLRRQPDPVSLLITLPADPTAN